MGMRIGICGAGAFSECFIPLFKAHPLVDKVVLADLDREKCRLKAGKFGVMDCYRSLDELCALDLDAIAIFTQHHLHGPQAVQALRAGKHVYSAVPSAVRVEEMVALEKAVRETGKTYMVGETSVYYPCAIFCRDRFRAGAFGNVVYAEGEYYHDYNHGLIPVLQHRHGEDWEHYANWPPSYYPTHSVSLVVSVTGARVTEVACMGIEDREADRLFHRENQYWDNAFSNEVMLCRMSDGSVSRFNEFRRIAVGANRMRLYGTLGAYEQQTESWIWVEHSGKKEDLREKLACRRLPVDPESGMAILPAGEDGTHQGVSSVHPVHLLPREFMGLPNGHAGSHQFLVHDFLTACASGELPPHNHVWDAARYLLPGLIGHESALKGGVKLEVPDLGEGAECIDGGRHSG